MLTHTLECDDCLAYIEVQFSADVEEMEVTCPKCGREYVASLVEYVTLSRI